MASNNPASLPPLGLYCHVPFCASTCDFCAFYQEKPRRGDIDRYLRAIEQELALLPPDRPADTFFWGGGTPGLLPAEDLLRLGENFLRANTRAPEEWTVEMAPSAVKPAKLAALRQLGVTRISMGVQSFDPATLDALGRQHSPRQIYQAWEMIRAAEFPDTSLDLIFAVPGQDEQRWKADLAEAVRLAPQHISTYCLTFEEDTALFVKLSKGKVAIDPERDATLYRRTWQFLENHGFPQYEISNFSRPSHTCRHNCHTWRMAEWIGYGPAAASQWRNRRFQNPANLDHWAQSLAEEKLAHEQIVELTPEMLFADALVFGLRMNEGVDLEENSRRFAVPISSALRQLGENLRAEELLRLDGTRWQLTLEGRLRADAIGSAILETA